MDYGKIISTGFSQAWKHKSLWILGLFAAGSGGGGFNIPSRMGRGEWGGDWGDWPGIGRLGSGQIRDMIENIFTNPAILFVIIAAVLGLFLIFLILNVISVGGLIDAARRFKTNQEYSLGKVFGAGVHFFWRILGIGILTFITMMAVIILFVLLVVAAFFIHKAFGVLTLLVILPILIVVVFIVTVTVALAERIIVIQDRPVFDSISDSFNLWKANLGPAVIYSLIYLGISIAIGIGTLLVVAFVIIPFVAVGFVNLLLALLIGLPVLVLVLLVVSGFTGAGTHLMTTEFYYQLSARDRAAAIPPETPGTGYTPPPPTTPPTTEPPPPPSDNG